MDQYFEDVKHKLNPVIERRKNRSSLLAEDRKASVKMKLSEIRATGEEERLKSSGSLSNSSGSKNQATKVPNTEREVQSSFFIT